MGGKRIVLDSQGRKRCPQCKEYKALEMFGSDPSDTFGRTSWCLVCLGKTMSARYSLAYYRNRHLIRSYGITSEMYETLRQEQGGVCACCGRPPDPIRPGRTRRTVTEPMLVVDHSHQTGKVRGLLCYGCNQALGLLNEDLTRISALAAYLQKHQDE